MGLCVGRHPILTFAGFKLRDFFFANSDFNITFRSETFQSFNSSEDDLSIVCVASFIITKIMAKLFHEISKFSDIIRYHRGKKHNVIVMKVKLLDTGNILIL